MAKEFTCASCPDAPHPPLRLQPQPPASTSKPTQLFLFLSNCMPDTESSRQSEEVNSIIVSILQKGDWIGLLLQSYLSRSSLLSLFLLYGFLSFPQHAQVYFYPLASPLLCFAMSLHLKCPCLTFFSLLRLLTTHLLTSQKGVSFQSKVELLHS